MDLAALGNLVAGAAAAVAAWEATKTAKRLLDLEERRQRRAEEAAILEEKRRIWLATMLAELHVAARRNMDREWPAIVVEAEEAAYVRWAVAEGRLWVSKDGDVMLPNPPVSHRIERCRRIPPAILKGP